MRLYYIDYIRKPVGCLMVHVLPDTGCRLWVKAIKVSLASLYPYDFDWMELDAALRSNALEERLPY